MVESLKNLILIELILIELTNHMSFVSIDLKLLENLLFPDLDLRNGKNWVFHVLNLLLLPVKEVLISDSKTKTV